MTLHVTPEKMHQISCILWFGDMFLTNNIEIYWVCKQIGCLSCYIRPSSYIIYKNMLLYLTRLQRKLHTHQVAPILNQQKRIFPHRRWFYQQREDPNKFISYNCTFVTCLLESTDYTNHNNEPQIYNKWKMNLKMQCCYKFCWLFRHIQNLCQYHQTYLQ